ncbi:MAG TPA: AAA family ATPase [Rubellimicrobium sp.]|nr:AAA family ATPase [Rubellimicrobium sp.]
MQRVLIVGQPGSGKSSLARALGARTDLPVTHLDLFHWAPGWTERPPEERLRLTLNAAAREAWIIEGNYFATWEARALRADLLIWLDRSVGLRLWRVTRRLVLSLGRSRPDLPEGCPERLGRNMLVFLRYIWATRRSGRDDIARRAASFAGPVVRLNSDEEVRRFLEASEAGWPPA